MLFLVGSNGHARTAIHKNVGGLQHGIVEQPRIWVESFVDFLLVRHAPLKPRHWDQVVEDPGQFGDLGHIALDKQRSFIGVEAQGQVVQCHIHGVLAHLVGIVQRRERVVVDDEVVRFVLRVQVKMLTQGAVVVAQVQASRGLDARHNDRIGGG